MSEFFGDGSRFIGAADNVRRQVQCPLHAQQPIPHGLFRLDGEPQYVLGRVHVAIVDGAATRARPGSYIHRHLDLAMTAAATCLAGRRPAIHDDRFAPVPLGLVLHLPPELAHPDIGDVAGEVVVLHHPLHVQVFHADDIGTANDGRGGLVQEIGTAGGDMGVQLGDADPLFRAPLAALLHPRQPPLLPLEVAQASLEVARVAGLVAGAGDRNVADAEVNAHRLPGGRHRLDEFLATERHEVAPAGVLADRRHLRRAVRYPRPADLERAQLGQLEQRPGRVGSRHLPLVELIPNRLLVVSALETRELGAALKEILERLVLIDQRLGQAPARAFFQKLVARFPRKLRDGRVQRARVYRLDLADFSGLPVDTLAQIDAAVQQAGLLAGEQGGIPREARVAELHRQLLALGGVRVDAESIGFELRVHVEYDNAHSISLQQVGHAKSRQDGIHQSIGDARVQGTAESAGGSESSKHHGLSRMAGFAGVGNHGRGRANTAEKAARIGASRSGGRPAPGGPANAPRAARPVRSLRNAFSDHRGRRASVRSFEEIGAIR